MALSACINGAALTALLALFLVPAEHLLPARPPPAARAPPAARPPPAADLWLAGCVLLTALASYPCDWIHRKLLERRLRKLKQQVAECTDMVSAREARGRQAEDTLRMAQAATTEYELLLYLLLRHHQPARRKPPHDGLYPEKPDGGRLARPDAAYGQNGL